MRKKDAFYRRVFLNKPRYQAGAHFLGYVRDEAGNVSGSMTIADCNRQINLEFWASSKAEASNNLRKAQTLAAAVSDFADAYAKLAEEKWGVK